MSISVIVDTLDADEPTGAPVVEPDARREARRSNRFLDAVSAPVLGATLAWDTAGTRLRAS